jgi:hypothetical protein
MDPSVRQEKSGEHVFPAPVSGRRILRTWWPLAFSWMLMGVEMPAISATMARLAAPEISLAAYGGVVFPLALIIESPVIMLLSASVALSRHRQAYQRMWRFMMTTSALLTGLHILVVFTPLYYVAARDIIGAPEEILEPARVGLMIMTPWTWAIAYRRFQQGVLIRYGYSGAVGVGTIVRLVSGGLILISGLLLNSVPGVIIGAAAQAAGVVSEAVYAGWRVRPVLRSDLPAGAGSGPEDGPLTWRAFTDFYLPLAMTSLISLLWQPVGSAGLSRMPLALSSLAAWPVLSGLTFLLRSSGIALNEVVVSMLERPGSWPTLRRFSLVLAAAGTGLHLVIAATPLANLYFRGFSALPADLAGLAQVGFWIALPMPALAVLQNLAQGTILYGKRTRGIPESVGIFFGVILSVLLVGVVLQRWPGLYVAMAGFVLASAAQLGWLWVRSRPVSEALTKRDGP